MEMLRIQFIVLLLLVSFAFSQCDAMSVAHAQDVFDVVQYSVKILCTTSGPAGPGSAGPANFETLVNIHNPIDTQAVFRMKFVPALGPKPSDPTKFSDNITLKGDSALSFSCRDLVLLFPGISIIDGFAVIRTRRELDVVAVYFSHPSAERGTGFFLERVPPRQFR